MVDKKVDLSNPAEIIQRIEDKFLNTEFNDLFQRMEEDYSVWNMETSPSNKTSYDSDIREKTKEYGGELVIISNDLRAFSDSVQSTLSSAEMQIKVGIVDPEGKDTRHEEGKLERTLEYAFKKADERLSRLLQPTLREASDWHACVRGWRAGRFLVYTYNGNVIFDFTAPDPRWLVYEVGDDDIVEVGYKFYRNGASLMAQYGIETGKKFNNECYDYWIKLDDGVYGNVTVTGDKIMGKQRKIKAPMMPWVIKPVAIRPPISDAAGIKLKGFGESLFAASRDINAARNRFVSVVANHAALLAQQGLINYYSPQGIKEMKDFYNTPGGVLNLPKGENEIVPSPLQEISQTVVGMVSWFDKQIEQVTLPRIPIGTPAPSGTLFNLAQEAGNKVFNPQLRNLNMFFADACRLIEAQLINGGIKLEFQDRNRQTGKYYQVKVSPVDLKKEHTIEVNFTAKTPYRQLITAQVADMLERAGVPQRWIWENIYMFPDPALLEDLAALELYEHSPEGAMAKVVDVLMRYDKKFEAQKLVGQMDMMQPQQSPQETAVAEGQAYG